MDPFEPPAIVVTTRLAIRPPVESDRSRFVELFGDREYMVFAGGVLTEAAANARFDRMLANCRELIFAKQPVVERASGRIVGYAGVDWYEFEGEQRLEYGYRLVPSARGKGYATEAGRALLKRAGESFDGELLALIAPDNRPSLNVARKLGFSFAKDALLEGEWQKVHVLQIGERA